MDITAYLFEVAATYERSEGLQSSAQRLLRGADQHLSMHGGPGWIVQGSGGQGGATFTPWVAFLDPEETASPQYGIYVVYLFDESLERVFLSLNQGITRLTQEFGPKSARLMLAASASAVRASIDPRDLERLSSTMSLSSTGSRQLAYQAGNIACLEYLTASLPNEGELRSDLSSMLSLYRRAVIDKQRGIRLSSNLRLGSTEAFSDTQLTAFHPKDDTEYLATIAGKTIRKTRAHEGLVRRFGEWASEQNFPPSTPHPCDLVLTRGPQRWLVEAKVIYAGDATAAVRAALGQLFEYRYFLFKAEPLPRLVALFDQPIGEAYSMYLSGLGIIVVCERPDQGEWDCFAPQGPDEFTHALLADR